RIADLTTPAPGLPGVTFTSFGDPVTAGVTPQPPQPPQPEIMFVATLSDGREGIYGELNGQIHKLYDTTDLLNGQHPMHFEIGPDAYANVILAFKATFADGSQALYEDQPFVPEPAGFSLVCVGTTAILMRRRGLPT